jgi:uncharacterized protein YdeI (YjbR/CyaY-like superfamily)
MPERILFKDRNAFRKWLQKNHTQPDSIWLVLGKNSKLKTLSADEALEEALCFGWIDGLIKKVDETQYIKLLSPRRKRSNWSEKNKKTAEQLIKKRLMMPPGIQAIEEAKKNGIWEGPKRLEITQKELDMFVSAIASFSLAANNFKSLPPSSKRMYVGFYLDAKKEDTRQRRLAKLIGFLEQNKKSLM